MIYPLLYPPPTKEKRPFLCVLVPAMSSFIAAMDALSLRTRGENGSPEWTADGVGDARVALFVALVRNLPEPRLQELVQDVLKQATAAGKEQGAGMVADLVVLAFQTRFCRGGKGERLQFHRLLLQLAPTLPHTMAALVPLIPRFGYWKDLLILLEMLAPFYPEEGQGKAPAWVRGLQEACIETMAKQLREDEAALEKKGHKELSLLGKWAPRQGKHFAKGAHNQERIYHALRTRLYPTAHDASRRYRRLLSRLSAALQVPEVLMCAQRYDELNFAKVPALCLNRFRKAFLNEQVKTLPTAEEEETGNRHPDDEKRVAARQHLRAAAASGGVKGGPLLPHDLVRRFMHNGRATSTLEQDVLCAQWAALLTECRESLAAAAAEGGREEGAVDLGRVVPLVDVSGSMSGTPMEVAIALGILTSELTAPPFRHRLLTFHESPTWVDLSSCQTLVDKVQTTQAAPWGMSTDFAAALQLILDACIAAKLPASEVPSALLVFSDMQFDQANNAGAWETHHERLVRLFHAAGVKAIGAPYPVPKIVYWNLRGDTGGFPAQADTPNVQMLSGFSPSLLKLLLTAKPLSSPKAGGGKSEVTPYDTLRAALDDEAYDVVRLVLTAGQEGPLGGYQFSRAVEGEGEEADGEWMVVSAEHEEHKGGK